MAIGKRKRERQETLWIPTSEIPTPPAHPFYKQLNSILNRHGFDEFVEKRCGKFYAPHRGRPGLIPGIYFRLLLVGYFEGLDSERGIAWRAADSLALRSFLGLRLTEVPPDHSVRLLEEEGARITYNDPFVPEIKWNGDIHKSTRLTPALIKKADIVVVLTDHTAYSYDNIVKNAKVVFDSRNATKNVKEGRNKIVLL